MMYSTVGRKRNFKKNINSRKFLQESEVFTEILLLQKFRENGNEMFILQTFSWKSKIFPRKYLFQTLNIVKLFCPCGCPVPAVLSQLSSLSVIIPQHSCPQLSCHRCPVFAVMSWPPCDFCQLCPVQANWPVKTDLSVELSILTYPGRPGPVVLSQVSYQRLMSQLFRHGCPSRFSGPCCHVLTIL